MTSSKKRFGNICVVTSPRSKAGVPPLSNLVEILQSLSENLYLVTGNEGSQVFNNYKKLRGFSINYNLKTQPILRILNFIYLNLKISYYILTLSKSTNLFIFFMAEGLLLPVIITKILQKPIILNLAASSPKMIDSRRDTPYFVKVLKFLELINYSLADIILVYSQRLVEEWNLIKYKNKILVAHEHFLDFDTFSLKKELHERNFMVGYIGRLSEEKGVLNFVETIPYLLDRYPNMEFLLGGTGDLQKSIEQYLISHDLINKVQTVGWIPHDQLPNYLNELKLIVLPSYTEGLPNILLESMACGTPVIATPVGAIPDIIIDGVTGFILNHNCPKDIEINLIRAIESPHLECIAEKSRLFVKSEFTYEAAVELYRNVFLYMKM